MKDIIENFCDSLLPKLISIESDMGSDITRGDLNGFADEQ